MEEGNYAKQLTPCGHVTRAAQTSATVTSDTYCVPRVELGLVEMGGGWSWVGGWRDSGGPHGGGGMSAGTGSFSGNKDDRYVGGVGCADDYESRRRCRARARGMCFIYLPCLKAGKEDSRTGLPAL